MSSSKYAHLALATDKPVSISLTGHNLLTSPAYNKGTAFTAVERQTFGLHGLLPTNVQTLDGQVKRAYQQYSSRDSDIAKNTFMTSMAEQNTVLYYRLIQDHLKEMFSVIYTPTEGEAIENYSRLFRKPDGCFLNIKDVDQVEERMAKFGTAETVDYIVVSDGEEILGIGDQGVGGILISIAKLVLTTACAGIHPARTLPVVLDTGTDNEELLNDELYLGLKHKRIRGKEYDDFVDRFVKSARKLYPNAYIHFEDFGVTNARKILDRYRDSIPCFNDDIQGTGCVTLAGIMAGLHVSKVKLTDMRMIVFGSGSAGCGIAAQVAAGIAADCQKSASRAGKQIWCLDRDGLLIDNMDLSIAQKPFARSASEWQDKKTDLQSVIRDVKPHVLIGTSTKPGAFTEEIVHEMASHTPRPIIFPLSNPTRLHEAQPTDINEWTSGAALIATGSPFPPVEIDGKKREVAECNNSTCFPGIGLGCVLSRSKKLSDKMLIAAIKALAAEAPALEDPNGALLPDVVDVREISVKIARAVIRAAQEEELAQVEDAPESDEELDEWIKAQMWEPIYRDFVKEG
jgi:malate dehydrogenase (oxaloacetate-decarboxylating)